MKPDTSKIQALKLPAGWGKMFSAFTAKRPDNYYTVYELHSTLKPGCNVDTFRRRVENEAKKGKVNKFRMVMNGRWTWLYSLK